MTGGSVTDAQASRRWRLILGSEADHSLCSGQPLEAHDLRRDRALDALYGRELDSRDGGVGRPQPHAVHWLGEVRKLFPQSAAEILQRDALQRYGMTGLLQDPQVLREATPSIELVQALMAVRESLPQALLVEVLALIRRVVQQLEQRLAPKMQAAFAARRRRHGSGGRPRLADLDWARTLRHNLKHYQPESQQLVLERLFFHPREERRLPWHLWLVVDQSGSMAASVIHSAVMAGIFARLQTVQARLLLFSDGVVDVSDQLAAPERLLLGAQLGGGTNIGAGLAAAGAQLQVPRRSVVVLVSDLYEGYDSQRVLDEVSRLVGSGVRVLALAALDGRAQPDYDRNMAQRMTQRGAEVAAMTPEHLVDWLAAVMQGGPR